MDAVTASRFHFAESVDSLQGGIQLKAQGLDFWRSAEQNCLIRVQIGGRGSSCEHFTKILVDGGCVIHQEYSTIHV